MKAIGAKMNSQMSRNRGVILLRGYNYHPTLTRPTWLLSHLQHLLHQGKKMTAKKQVKAHQQFQKLTWLAGGVLGCMAEQLKTEFAGRRKDPLNVAEILDAYRDSPKLIGQG